MRKLTEKEREEIIEKIMEDVQGNLYNYQNFVLDCVRETVIKWTDEDLYGWSGEGLEQEEE